MLTPSIIPGLSVSVDWYSINIKSAIYTASTTQILAECALGLAQFCAGLVYDGTQYPGALGHVVATPLNAASQTTSGLDFCSTTRWTCMAERWPGIWSETILTSLPATRWARATVSGGQPRSDSTITGVPKLKAQLAANYTSGAWSGTIQGRLIGAAVLNTAWTTGVQVSRRTIFRPWVTWISGVLIAGTRMLSSMSRWTMR